MNDSDETRLRVVEIRSLWNQRCLWVVIATNLALSIWATLCR